MDELYLFIFVGLSVMQNYMNLRGLLDPLPVETFFEEHLDEAPAFVGGKAEKTAHLFGWEEVNTWLNNSKLWSNKTLKLHNEGSLVPAESYCFGGINRDLQPIFRPDPAIVVEYLAGGACLELSNFEGADPSLLHLTQALGSAFGSKTEVRLRCGGPHEPSEIPDYEAADAFHIQLGGSSYCALFEERATATDETQPDQVAGELEMTTGDVLYLPSGQFYRYAGLNKECLALTVFLQRPSGVALFSLISECLTDSVLFRGDLPFYDEKLSSDAHLQELAGEASKILASDDFGSRVAQFQRLQMSLAKHATFSLPRHKVSSVYRTGVHAKIPAGLGEGAIEIARWAKESEIFALDTIFEAFPKRQQKEILDDLRELEDCGFLESVSGLFTS